MHIYIVPIAKKFRQQADTEKATWMKAYMLYQFDFYGLQTPERRKLCKEHYQEYTINNLTELEAIVKECFHFPQREYQYFGVELFAFHKKFWKKSSVKLMEYCLLEKSWWDSVDHIASEWLGPFFKLFPEQIIPVTAKWNVFDNKWLQRSSILFQKAYKKETDTALLSKYILHCKCSKEFFIQKAIGWALREYSKTNPGWVIKFVKENQLALLSTREALKRIDR